MADALKILMLNYEFPPIGGGGGVVSSELCRQLVKMGHHVDVVTMHYRDLPRAESLDGVNIFRTPALRKRGDLCRTHEMASYLLGAGPRTMRLIKRTRHDIIHAHFMIPTAPLAWLAARLTGRPFIVTCHGSDVPGHNPQRFVRTHKLILPAWRFLTRRCDRIICPSAALRQSIRKHTPDATVDIIPNGIDCQAFTPTEKTDSILMCSRLFDFKGFQYAIDAIKQMNLPWQVNIIGEGPYLEELKTRAADSATPIKFWGWLGKSDPRFYELFKASSIFVFPSEAENFPTVLLEALASGMAVITSTAGGCPEVVGDAALLVEPRDPDAIADKLRQLVNSPQLREKLMAAALARAGKFSWPGIAQQYVDTYREVIA